MNSFKERIKRKYNVAVAELDFQDKWQRTHIGVVTLNSQQTIVQDWLNKILAEARDNVPGAELLHHEAHFF